MAMRVYLDAGLVDLDPVSTMKQLYVDADLDNSAEVLIS